MTVGEALVHVRITLLLLCLGVFLFLFKWPQIGHSQPHNPPEVVIPLRVTGTASMNAPGWFSYSLHFGGQRHIIHLKVTKHLVSRSFSVFTYTDQGALVEEQPFVQNDCYYHGFVEEDPESIVALSNCSGGFQGLLLINDIAYEINPKRFSATFEHLIYKIDNEETQFPPRRCGLTEEEIARQLKLQKRDNSTLMQSAYEGWWTHKWFIELAVVVDHERFLHQESNISNVQLEAEIIVHIIDAFYTSLKIDVVLLGIEIWNKGNVLATDDIEVLLRTFCQWKRVSLNSRIQHDVAHIFVKKGFGIHLGLAYVGTVCNIFSNCGVDSFLHDRLLQFAFIVTHEIGHNLGMLHDVNPCTCGHSTCIMFPTETPSSRFSNCSYDKLVETSVRTICMRNAPRPGDIFTLKRCGNGVVEEGEQCDCGTLQLCTRDPCCSADCTLKPGTACAFGLCCKDCQFMPLGTVCREKANECDLPEWCNGASHNCPADVHVQDGVRCMGGGYCYERRCNIRDEQCRQIFGKKAKSANQSCYREMNVRGDRFGHCGLNGSTYVRCQVPDILCGRVQCENVTEIPLLKDHSTVHWAHSNGVTCWSTDYHFGMTIPDIGEVKDGTECGAEHVCIRRRCVPMSLWSSSCSPETCNMRGVCNNKHHCHCSSEWDPPDCLTAGSGGSVDSGPPPRRKVETQSEVKRKYLILLLWIPFLLTLWCMLLWLCDPHRKLQKKDEQNVQASS
ncbi:PREDICTED: disintegrin and metalloproteinase domain-containing protein 25-like [Galeopterus variegatus]|uniref:Disintegrin and metalloproteinase domain-containing protein 25-like n=1 Tax=Galeopterus variegatus TaxID=482537 RepID=A0ABM0QK82_GALVR|nr:PREDICTED: disintegrin and metalloproteinase domain-containing protein 25-like [Galeopterus variegatus]